MACVLLLLTINEVLNPFQPYFSGDIRDLREKCTDLTNQVTKLLNSRKKHTTVFLLKTVPKKHTSPLAYGEIKQREYSWAYQSSHWWKPWGSFLFFFFFGKKLFKVLQNSSSLWLLIFPYTIQNLCFTLYYVLVEAIKATCHA